MNDASQMGIVFERWVSRLYDELGKLNIKHDVTKSKTVGGNHVRSQFDVTYGLVDKRYIECKLHLNGEMVPFEDVATFGAKLKINGIAPTQGVMVTNTGYDARAQAYAHKTGITLIDRPKLVRMDWRRVHQLQALVRPPPEKFEQKLEERVMAYAR